MDLSLSGLLFLWMHLCAFTSENVTNHNEIEWKWKLQSAPVCCEFNRKVPLKNSISISSVFSSLRVVIVHSMTNYGIKNELLAHYLNSIDLLQTVHCGFLLWCISTFRMSIRLKRSIQTNILNVTDSIVLYRIGVAIETSRHSSDLKKSGHFSF